MSFTHDLIEHIVATKDSQNKQGKYVLRNGLETKDILFAIPIPQHCKTIGDAYFLGSIIRRAISYIADGNPNEALKLAHELSMVYDKGGNDCDSHCREK
jgi:hypothetical protein